MSCKTDVTKKNYKKYVEERIREYVATVVWGGNASKVQEVLVFPEQYLCGSHIKVEIRDLICQHLLDNKFGLSFVAKQGKRQREWALPLNPTSEPFISIRRECEDSLKAAIEFYDQKAKEAVKKFATSRLRSTVFKTDNSLYRESLRKELLLYPAYIVSTTYAKDWVHAVKYGEPYNKIYEDYLEYIRFVDMHIRQFFDFLGFYREREKIGGVYFDGGGVRYRVFESSKKFVVYTSIAVVNDFITRMRKYGFEATSFPMHELSSYVEIGLKPYDGIPVYLEICSPS